MPRLTPVRPRHDPTPRVPAGRVPTRLPGNWLTRLRAGKRPGRDGDLGGEACPVVPRRPLDLSGGAAAALAFDA